MKIRLDLFFAHPGDTVKVHITNDPGVPFAGFLEQITSTGSGPVKKWILDELEAGTASAVLGDAAGYEIVIVPIVADKARFQCIVTVGAETRQFDTNLTASDSFGWGIVMKEE